MADDKFRACFKKYKRRDRPLDRSEIFDVNDLSTWGDKHVSQFIPAVQERKISIDDATPICGIKPANDWTIVQFTKHKGFFLIKNPFQNGYQHFWVSRCLEDLPLTPNVTNLRVHSDINPDTLWSQFAADYHSGIPADNTSPIKKLRWTTIGYHYNWDTKEYNEADYTPFPEDIGILAQHIAQVLGFSGYQPQAGIINYYHLDSSLGGHTDHSELDHEAPLISISFGQDAIFLLGGLSKEEEPTAILLHSGDICVMSGLSRLAYHAVPRILPSGAVDCGLFLPQCVQAAAANADSSVGIHKLFSCSKEMLGDAVSKDSDSWCEPHCVKGWYTDGTSSDNTKCNFSEEALSRDKMCTCNRHESARCCVHDETETECKEVSTVEQSSSVQSFDLEEWRRIRRVNKMINERLQNMDWSPFAAYLNSSRLNINIRQVLKPGQYFPKPVLHKDVELLL